MEKNVNELTSFQWDGVSKTGQVSSGITQARSLIAAKTELRKQGIIIHRISKKRKPFFSGRSKKIKQADITIFSRQLSTMIEAGIPLIQSFDIVSKGQTNQRMKALIEAVKKEIESGTTLAESLRKHPLYFNELFCNLVDAGEKSGSLDIMLDKVATYKEKFESIKKKIKKALTYPMAVLAIAFLVSAGLLMFVVPQFQSLFQGFGADLPAMTRGVISLSQWFESYWYLIFGAIFAAGYGLYHARLRSPAFAHWIDKTVLKIPVMGTILQQAAIARFARTLSITFAAGLPLIEALKSVGGATGNILYAEATTKIGEEVSSGQQLFVAMENTKLFPSMVIQMVAIGEESGALEQMLSKVADFYEEAVDNAVDALSSLLEPMIMAVLGVLVGGLVIAMYLPIFKLGSVV